ncbi:Abi family protein [Aliikangiella sp. IMCC44632]
MSRLQYNKPALSFTDQLSKLEQRGMAIENHQDALNKLSSISYYRLSGYWFPFRLRDMSGNVSSDFEPNTTFNKVAELYEFDRKLRELVLDAIERVEVAVRTQFTYHIGRRYGAFGHTNASNFHNNFDHLKWLSKLQAETERSSDKFIKHYKDKYQGFPTIPIWMLTEVISLGGLSFGYQGLRNDRRAGVEDKKAISDHFNLHHKKLSNWLHTLTYIRNVCAHHSRLWNRELAIRPDSAREPEWSHPLTPRNNRIFYMLLILRYLQRQIGNGEDWAASVNQILTPVSENRRWRVAMGMPDNWREHPLWK